MWARMLPCGVVEPRDGNSDLGGIGCHSRVDQHDLVRCLLGAPEAPAMVECEIDRLSSGVLAGNDTRTLPSN